MLGSLLVLTGCGSTTAASTGSTTASTSVTQTPAAPSIRSIRRYVALGDSYTAAPYVYLTDVAKGCLRSNGNYPALLATRLDVHTLVDVSCSGATTADLVAGQSTFGGTTVPPQLAALTKSTRLVTVGLGGNDVGLFASLSSGCPLVGPHGTRPAKRAGTCGHVDQRTAVTAIPGIAENLTLALQAVHHKAPRAVVVLVGYPRIVSLTSSCPRLLPVAHADAVVIDRVTHRLSDAMRATAKDTGTRFVDMYAASRGHDVCAGRAAWVNGVKTDTSRAASLHPFAAEQRAVAQRIAQILPPR
ncbi:MAG: SGNH/GDSL hydrolase family protein [Marmoricola sp.]